MFYPKGGFTTESHLNQKFHWAVLNSPKGTETSVEGKFLREKGSTSWKGFGSHLCGHPWPHSDVQIVLGPSTGVHMHPSAKMDLKVKASGKSKIHYGLALSLDF